jgi:hypothetical protein
MCKVLGLLLILLAFACPWQSAAAADNCAAGTLQRTTIEAGDVLQLRWVGTVAKDMPRAILDAFTAHRPHIKSVALSLNSCGGRVDYMAEVIAVLRHIGKTHQLVTAVEPGSLCASACIPIFLASNHRRAAMSSLWFFHRSWRRELTGGVDKIETASIGNSSLDDFLARYFRPAGVSAAWLSELKGIIENGDGYWQTGRELWDAKAGMLTEAIGNVQPREKRTIYFAPAPGCTAMCRG